MINYSKVKLGTLVIDQNGQEFKIQIRQGNCLAVFIYVRLEDDHYMHTLYGFFTDVTHLKNIVKEHEKPFLDEVKKIRLNMRYKECYILLRELVKHYTVECYYE